MNPVNPKNFLYCPVCGANLTEKYLDNEQTHRLICEQCGFIFYMNPVPAVAVILMRGNDILLVKRKYQPQVGDWTLPAGFMEYGETPEQTAIRETKEETNLDISVNEVFAVLPGSYDSKINVVLIIYKGEISGGRLHPGDDAAEVKFFPLDKLPPNIAFSAHREVLTRLKKSNNKII